MRAHRHRFIFPSQFADVLWSLGGSIILCLSSRGLVPDRPAGVPPPVIPAWKSLVSSFRLTVVALVALTGLVCLSFGGCRPSEGIHQVRVPAEISERRDKPALPGGVELPSPSGPKYQAPEGWVVQPNAPMQSLTLAVVDGDQRCDVGLTRLGPGQSDLDNVNRWCGQIMIDPIDKAALAGIVKPVECGPHKASMVQLVGATETILGVIVSRPDATWFVKLRGPNALALRELGKFVAFTKSLELP